MLDTEDAPDGVKKVGVDLEMPWNRSTTPNGPASRRSLAVVGGVVLAALGLAVLLPFQVQAYRDAKGSNPQTLGREARVAVSDVVVRLTSPSAKDSEDYVNDLLERSTGAFKDQLAQIAQTFESTVKEAGVEATSRITSSAVSKVDPETKTVSILLTVVQDLKNTANPEGEPRYYRVKVTAIKRDGTWLMSDMRFVA